MLGCRVHPLRGWLCFDLVMTDGVFVRDLGPDEGQKLLRIIRRSSGSVVTWRRAQIVLWSAQRMSVPAIAEIAFTSEDRSVR
jgi:hypothetical protein